MAFHRVLREMGDLHDKKSADYGRDHDPFYNIRAIEQVGIDPLVGIYIRLQDKMARVGAWIINGSLENESLRDTFRDMAVYNDIAVVLIDEREGQEQANGGTTTAAAIASDEEREHFLDAITEQRAAHAWAQYAHAALSTGTASDAGDAVDGQDAAAGSAETGLDGAAVHDRPQGGRSVFHATDRQSHAQPFTNWLSRQDPATQARYGWRPGPTVTS